MSVPTDTENETGTEIRTGADQETTPTARTAELAPCRKCDQPIPADVETCPECEFNYSQAVVGTGLSLCMVGGLLTILVVTAIIGIPMVLLGLLVALGGAISSKPAADVDGDLESAGASSKPWYLKSFPQLYREWRK